MIKNGFAHQRPSPLILVLVKFVMIERMIQVGPWVTGASEIPTNTLSTVLFLKR